MRLEQGDDAAARISPPRGIERRANLGGMVGIVVHDQCAEVVAEDLEAAVDTEELCERGRDHRYVDAELAADGDRGERVENVVLTGHEQLEESDPLDVEGDPPIGESDVRGPEV